MSSSDDTWRDIQAHRSKQSSLREKLARRKKERQETGQLGPAGAADLPSIGSNPAAVTGATAPAGDALKGTPPSVGRYSGTAGISPVLLRSPAESSEPKETHLPPDVLKQVERHLLLMLSDITIILPMEVSSFLISTRKHFSRDLPESAVEGLMQKFATQLLINLEMQKTDTTEEVCLVVESVDHTKLSAVTAELEIHDDDTFSKKRKKDSEEVEGEKSSKMAKKNDSSKEDMIASLLLTESAKQRESKKMNDEILQLLCKPTAKEQSLIEKFKSQGGAQVKEFCPNGTKDDCMKSNLSGQACDKLHFRKIINKHTDESLGDCSFLNTCFHMDTCKYVHYEVDYPEYKPRVIRSDVANKSSEGSTILFPPQWVQCDLRSFDMAVLGKFMVIMADPPWDIHMELPYGTMSDDEMRKLQVPVLQDDGYIFLWVTGRAMELGRECLQLWGYERVDELIWVKTNQLQRIIRTGRTGHWLNHGKEHCLVGMKGNPKNVNRGLDCDVIVAEVRATSHKPDEIYGIIERLSPGTRKIELFGRPHNVQPNWFTLGNQLDGVKLNEPDVVKAYKERYPDGNCRKPS